MSLMMHCGKLRSLYSKVCLCVGGANITCSEMSLSNSITSLALLRSIEEFPANSIPSSKIIIDLCLRVKKRSCS